MKGLLKSLALVAVVIALAIVAVPAVDAAYTRDLTIGSSGSDVAELQAFLVSKGFLVMPAGTTPGYFGTLTQAALARYQAANGIVPPAGYFGPLTRSSVESMGTTAPVAGLPAGCSSTAGFSSTTGVRCDSGSSSSPVLGSGEASLESYDLDEEEDEIREGQSEVVAIAKFDVEDGDVEIQRVDATFTFEGAGDADDEPWDVFEEITLIVDGSEVASVDASDEDEWLSDDEPFVVRFSGLDIIVEEGETAEIEISVVARDNVDGADDGDAEWEISIADEGIRAIDGEGIYQYIGDEDIVAAFEVVSEADGDDLNLESSDDEIEEDTIILDESDNTEASIFAFVLSADDSDTDIEINDIEIGVEVSAGEIGDFVRDFWIEIDGETIDAETYNNNVASTTLTFEVDGDVVIDAGDEVEVVLYAEFRSMDSDSALQGETIVASVDADQIEAEGADDVDVDGSGVDGEEQTLMTAGIYAEFVSEAFTSETDEANGMIKIVFELTAVGDDFEIAEDGSDFDYDLTNATFVDARVNVSGADLDGGDYEVKERTTSYRTTLSVEFSDDAGFVGLEINEILGYVVRDLIANEGN
jgi:hypothetical protein